MSVHSLASLTLLLKAQQLMHAALMNACAACAAGAEEVHSSQSSELSAWDGDAQLMDSELSDWSGDDEAVALPKTMLPGTPAKGAQLDDTIGRGG